jgi:hypothetical protein
MNAQSFEAAGVNPKSSRKDTRMKNRLYAIAGAFAVAAVAASMVTATASADVARYQTQQATFTVTQPYGQVGQWQNLWTHNLTVTVNPCNGTFSGTGLQYDNNHNLSYHEDVTGSFNSDGTVNLTATRDDGVVWSLASAPTDNSSVTLATTSPVVPWNVEMKVSQPVLTDTSAYKNHGAYVSSQGGGADAAHSCIGMPVVSNAGR